MSPDPHHNHSPLKTAANGRETHPSDESLEGNLPAPEDRNCPPIDRDRTSRPAVLTSRWGPGLVADIDSIRSRTAPERAERLVADLSERYPRANELQWIAARIRTVGLLMTREELAEHIRSTPNEIAYAEGASRGARPGWRPKLEVLSGLIRTWAQPAHTTAHSLDTVALCREGRARFLNRYESRLGGGVYGVLCGWRLEVGPVEFKQRTGWQYNTLFSRRGGLAPLLEWKELIQGTLALFPEIRTESAGCEDALRSPRVARLLTHYRSECARCCRPEAAVDLYVLACTALALGSFDAAPAELDSVMSMPPLSRVQHLFPLLHESGVLSGEQKDSLERRWVEERTAHCLQAEQGILRRIEADSMSWDHLAAALQLSRQITDDPPQLVRDVLTGEDRSPRAALGILTILTAADSAEADALLGSARTEIRNAHLRRGERVSPLLVERELWGIRPKDLGPLCGELLQCEARGPGTPGTKRFLHLIQQVGLGRAEAAVDRYVRFAAAAKSAPVCEVFDTAIATTGSPRTAAAAHHISTPRFEEMARGQLLPSLPELTRVAAAEKKLSPQLVAAWYDAAGRLAIAEGKSPLERALQVLIAAQASSRRELLNRLGLSQGKVWPHIESIRDLGFCSPDKLVRLMDLFEIRDERTRAYFTHLNRTGSVAATLHTLAAEIPELKHCADLQPPTQNRPQENTDTNGAVDIAALISRRRTVDNLGGVMLPEPLMKLVPALPGVTVTDLIAFAVKDAASKQQLPSGLPLRFLRTLAQEVAIDPSYSRDVYHEFPVGQANIRCLPAGITGLLSAASLNEAIRHVAGARRAARAELQAHSLQPTRGAVTLKIWGLRHEDTGLTEPDFRLVYTSDDRLPDDVAGRLDHAVRTKACRALTKATVLLNPVSVPERIERAAALFTEGTRGLTLRAGLPFSAVKQLADGSIRISLDMYLKALGESAGPNGDAAAVEWYLHTASSQRDADQSALARTLALEVLASRPRDVAGGSADTGNSASSLRLALPVYTKREQLSAAAQRALRTCIAKGTLAEEQFALLLEALYPRPSDRRRKEFVQLVYETKSTAAALASWVKTWEGDEQVASGFRRALRQLSLQVERRASSSTVDALFERYQLAREEFLERKDPAVQAAWRDARAVIHCIAGTTGQEMLQLFSGGSHTSLLTATAPIGFDTRRILEQSMAVNRPLPTGLCQSLTRRKLPTWPEIAEKPEVARRYVEPRHVKAPMPAAVLPPPQAVEQPSANIEPQAVASTTNGAAAKESEPQPTNVPAAAVQPVAPAATVDQPNATAPAAERDHGTLLQKVCKTAIRTSFEPDSIPVWFEDQLRKHVLLCARAEFNACLADGKTEEQAKKRARIEARRTVQALILEHRKSEKRSGKGSG